MTHPYPVPEIDPVEERFPVLSSRQEAFCRHFVATGNAADAARRSGYALKSARQTGHALLQRPHIVARVRQIRMLWREAERAEARILLARLEQAWDAAAARGSAWLMYLVIRKQEALSGLGGAGASQPGRAVAGALRGRVRRTGHAGCRPRRHRGDRPAGRAAGRRGAPGAGPGGARACAPPDRRRTARCRSSVPTPDPKRKPTGFLRTPSKTAGRSGARS